ncbi:MAG: hypothetical protein QOI73_2919 [Solirubrobacteraceae bacterium]|nr:hypothetical protein [Solirubrobacteraceae bacterium]
MYEIEKAIQEAAEEDSEFALVPADRLERAVRLTVAGKITLVAAEALLPAKSQSIDGENFWDRFTRVAHEREQGAEQQRMRDRGR